MHSFRAGGTLKKLFSITLNHLMKVQAQMKKFQIYYISSSAQKKKKVLKQGTPWIRL